MNSFPIGVSQMLLAPPPPPPPSLPPDSAVTKDGASAPPKPGIPSVVPQQGTPCMPPSQMIAPSHLALPPPPPPPPPEVPGVEPHAIGGSGSVYRMPYPNPMNRPPEHFTMHNNRRHPPGGQPFSFRGGPAPWAPRRQAPSGLQGPWQAPSAERPLGAFMQLRPPGVPGEHFISLNQTTETNTGPCIDSSSFPPGSANSEASNSSGANLSPAATTYKDHVEDPKDPTLPKELTNMFEALICKLCDVVSSSTVQARHHYSGRPHEKKVRQWLQKWSNETGQPLPKRPKMDNVVADVNPEDLYCKLCEVAFTSVKHGEQHRMGKPHQKALRLGYSTAKSKVKATVPVDPTGRFGIGDGFLKATSQGGNEPVPVEGQQDAPPVVPSLVSKTAPINSKFYCDLCKISTTSQEHLDAHYVGAKHRKALVNAAKAGIKTEPSVVPPPVQSAESILASVISDSGSRGRGVPDDLSIFRTPSGQFYCHPCNTTVNSEKTFKEHTESKRHKFKVASSKRF